MAEATAMRNNALPYPVYGAPWTVVFPMLDADGDLVTGATTPDAEVSKNGDTFADCTNESTEIATNSGIYYLTLTGTEMTADIVAVIAKSATAGMKTTAMTFYPRKLVSLRAGTSQAGAAGTITLDSGASAIDDYYNGCLIVGTLDSTTEARIITDYAGSTKVASVTPNWNTTPDSDDTFVIYLPEGRQIGQDDNVAFNGVATTSSAGRPEVNTTHAAGTAWGSGAITAASIATDAITAAKIATGAIDADAIAADAITAAKIADGAIDANTFAASAITASAIAADAITAAKIADGAIDANTFAAGAITASAIAADAIGASELAADAVAEIADAVWDEAQSGHTTAGSFGRYLDAQVANVETDTQDIQSRLPAALTAGGNIKADVLAISGDATAADNLEAALDGTGGVTITAALTGNITGNLSGSVGSVSGAVGSVTGNVGGNVSGSVGSVATGGITSGSFAAGAIDATAIATDAIGSSELAASAITEIQSGLSTLDAAGVRTAVGLASANLDTQLDALPTATENADALLNRDMGTGTDSGSSSVRTVRQALRMSRNKVTISGGTMTVYKEDDSTSSWTASVTTDSAANPITAVDATGP